MTMTPPMIAETPSPPYIAVIFSNLPVPGPRSGYAQTADDMIRLAEGQDGYLGMETAGTPDGLTITVSYWRDEAAVLAFRRHGDHVAAQKAGRAGWYRAYKVRVATVGRDYGFDVGQD